MKTVMAHGTFDLLHAGHVAHLEQAKAMGNYLIVGITADAYVAKGPGRPVVPAQDRARAVRALRCVDEVIIDEHPTPERMIAFCKPDFFVKGADYVGKPLPEHEWVSRYGGSVAFTSGETMYHSRQWISDETRMNIGRWAAQYGGTSMRGQLEAAGLRVSDLLAILDSAAAHRIHVVGDFIDDEYVDGELTGPLTLTVRETTTYAGGAGAVALHAQNAGAHCHLSYPRYAPVCKTRYYSEHGLAWQVNRGGRGPIDAADAEWLAHRLRTVQTDAVIFADYRHGVFHRDSIKALRDAIPNDALSVADSQVATRWGNINDFWGFNFVTPNEREARWATGLQDATAMDVAHTLAEHFPQMLMTRGADGLVGIDHDSTCFSVPALARTVVDPVGAGDALLAYATLGLLSRNSLVAAAWLGSIAAAIACSRRGNAPVTAAEVRQWLEAL